MSDIKIFNFSDFESLIDKSLEQNEVRGIDTGRLNEEISALENHLAAETSSEVLADLGETALMPLPEYL